MTVQSESAVGSVSVPSLPAKPSMLARITDKLISPFFAILLVAYWEFHVRYFEVDALLLPPPSKILVSLWHGLASGLFLEHLGITIYRALSGFLIAMFMGIALGALISQFKFIEKTVYPWVVALQTVPKIAIAPLILVWCGYGSLSKIVTATLVAFFPILVNTIIGLRSCEQGKLDLMRSLKAGRWLTFRMVQLPNALPFIFAGLSVAVVFSIRCAGRRVRRLQGRHRLFDPRCQLPAQHSARICTSNHARGLRHHLPRVAAIRSPQAGVLERPAQRHICLSNA